MIWYIFLMKLLNMPCMSLSLSYVMSCHAHAQAFLLPLSTPLWSRGMGVVWSCYVMLWSGGGGWCDSSMCDLQKIQSDSKALNSMLPSRRMEHERNMISTDRTLRTASLLAHHTLSLLWSLSQSRVVQGVFLRPEMVERISHSINHYVFKLAGQFLYHTIPP